MNVSDYPPNPYFPEDDEAVVRHRHTSTGRRLAGWPRETPSGCVVHFTAGWESDYAFTVMEKRNYSAHVVIERDGTIYLGVPLTDRAVHAGGSWKGQTNINHRFIGIELVNFGHVDGMVTGDVSKMGWEPGLPVFRPYNSGQKEAGVSPQDPWAYRMVDYGRGPRAVLTQQEIDQDVSYAGFPQAQIDALLWVVNSISSKLGWLEDNIIGHDFIDDHKQDPGPAFPWELFYEQLEAQAPTSWHGTQDLLQQMGLYTGQIDGIYGPLTGRAIYTITGLDSDGEITKDIWREVVLAWRRWRYNVE